MTSAAARVARRLAVVVFALACVSPATWRLPDLPSIPALLGFVPEPVLVAETPTPVFQSIDPAAAGVGAAPAQVAQRPQAQAGRDRQFAGGPKPPRPDRAAPGTAAKGSPLPTLPPDEIPRGRYHRVEPGETAASIAAAYGLQSQWAVYDANPIMTDPDAPPVGAWLYIPHPSMSPQPRPRPGQPGYSATPSATVIVDGIWLELAQCESSGDWGIDTGNGYFGGLQFTLSSWRAVGGAGHPHEAHPMEQIARADYLQRIQGWEAWPMCAGKLGLIPKAKADAIVDAARQRQRQRGGPTVEPGAEASASERDDEDGSSSSESAQD